MGIQQESVILARCNFMEDSAARIVGRRVDPCLGRHLWRVRPSGGISDCGACHRSSAIEECSFLDAGSIRTMGSEVFDFLGTQGAHQQSHASDISRKSIAAMSIRSVPEMMAVGWDETPNFAVCRSILRRHENPVLVPEVGPVGFMLLASLSDGNALHDGAQCL